MVPGHLMGIGKTYPPDQCGLVSFRENHAILVQLCEPLLSASIIGNVKI